MNFLDSVRFGAPLAALIFASWTLLKAAYNLYRYTAGSRREATYKIQRISCGVTIEYAEEFLGVPVFRSKTQIYEERVYYLRHAWVQVMINDADAIARIAITVIDRKFKWSASELSLGQIPMIIGVDPVSDRDSLPMSTYYYLGAHNIGYIKTHYAGNPGGYQYFALAYNDLSIIGTLPHEVLDRAGVKSYGEGVFQQLEATESSPSSREMAEFRKKLVPNTFIVTEPNSGEDLFLIQPMGTLYERVRLLPKNEKRLWRQVLGLP